MASSGSIPKLAVLDDYHGIARDHFSHIDPSKLEITVFNDSLPPYNHPSTSDADRKALVDRLKPFTILSTMRERTPFPGDLIRQLPNLKIILATGSHLPSFDLEAIKSQRIAVYAAPAKGRTDGKSRIPMTGRSGVPKGGAAATTQHTWALILALARNVAADDAVVKGKGGSPGWQTQFAIGLQGKTLGVLGLGKLGTQTAKVGATAFGLKIVAWSENLTQEKADKAAADAGLPIEGGGVAEAGEKTFKAVSKEEFFKTADIVSVHYALSPRSTGIVGAKELSLLKPSALLINTSRGPLIDEAALLDVLRKGKIRGAALDVYDIEPLPSNSPWRTEDWDAPGKSRVVLTPHMGYVQEGVLETWYEEHAENIERLLDGKELLNRL